jgi:Cd2+/Zn2+-exporting ATPase
MGSHESAESFGGRWFLFPPLRNALIAGVLSVVAFALGHLQLIPHLAEVGTYVFSIVLGGYHWAREGVEELFEERVVGIEVLMIAATVGSSALGLWDEAAALVVLYGAAEGLEELTYAKTRYSIRQLLDLAPQQARKLVDGEEIGVGVEELRPGDVFLIRPGEAIPTDGLILKGRSSINEAPITGEAVPVEKKTGDRVFSATINQEGALEVRVTASYQDNSLSRMIHLVEEAQAQKGKAQLFIERFGRRYTPLVLVAAALIIVVPAILGLPVSEWATRAMVFLVAAAPCALIMSTPVAIAAGIGTAGKHGVLIKGGVALENIGRIRAAAFDKTGTLTMGKPVVTDIVALKGDPESVLCLAATIERRSEHPIARAIVARAEAGRIQCLEPTDFSAVAGYGAVAQVQGRKIYVGKPGLFKRMGIEVESLRPLLDLRDAGNTVMLVGTDEGLEGIIALRDEVRPQAREILRQLSKLGIKTAMLTGDNDVSAKAVAEAVGIASVHADLKPEDKMLVLKELKQKYERVAMVGDGINDAPALASASVGVAMGAAGSDAAIEAADLALMSDDLSKLVFAVRIGRKARRVSQQNIVFSLVVLAVLIPAAVFGAISITVAVLAHEASELLAVANGLRAGRP